MTQEEKTLLLQDICGRLPYKVIVTNGCVQGELLSIETNIPKAEEIVYFRILSSSIVADTISNIKSYLRPLLSMTKRERTEYNLYVSMTKIRDNDALTYSSCALIDWLNSRHFDYRGLIPMGLALEAPKDMYNTKTE